MPKAVRQRKSPSNKTAQPLKRDCPCNACLATGALQTAQTIRRHLEKQTLKMNAQARREREYQMRENAGADTTVSLWQ